MTRNHRAIVKYLMLSLVFAGASSAQDLCNSKIGQCLCTHLNKVQDSSAYVQITIHTDMPSKLDSSGGPAWGAVQDSLTKWRDILFSAFDLRSPQDVNTRLTSPSYDCVYYVQARKTDVYAVTEYYFIRSIELRSKWISLCGKLDSLQDRDFVQAVIYTAFTIDGRTGLAGIDSAWADSLFGNFDLRDLNDTSIRLTRPSYYSNMYDVQIRKTDVYRIADLDFIWGIEPYVIYGPAGMPETHPNGKPQIRIIAAPNPFTQSTKLYYSGNPLQSIRIAVYDTRGQRVRTITDKSTGVADWNGRDMFNKRLPSGIYIARMSSGTQTCYAILNLMK